MEITRVGNFEQDIFSSGMLITRVHQYVGYKRRLFWYKSMMYSNLCKVSSKSVQAFLRLHPASGTMVCMYGISKNKKYILFKVTPRNQSTQLFFDYQFFNSNNYLANEVSPVLFIFSIMYFISSCLFKHFSFNLSYWNQLAMSGGKLSFFFSIL